MKSRIAFTSCLHRLAALIILGLLLASTPVHAGMPSVAFHYGDAPPTSALQAFDWAVVEPAHLPQPPQGGQTQWFAYLSLGEMSADRAYAKDVPAAWKQGRNVAWDSWIMDQTQPDWPAFVVNRIVTPLWNAGYRGFFLDTLDSWQAISHTDAERAAQAAGLVRTITAIKTRYPEIKLIANRGFEIMPQIHPWLSAVAFESYYQGWDATTKRYIPVSQADRNWLDEQLRPIQEKYQLPIIAIDYAPPKNRTLMRTTAEKLQQKGFIPWVADSQLQTMGTGNKESLARTVLIVYDSRDSDDAISPSIEFSATAINYLGYAHRLMDVADPAAFTTQTDDLVGVVSWLQNDKSSALFQPWIKKQLDAGIPWAALNHFGFDLSSSWQQQLKLKTTNTANPIQNIQILAQSPLLGFETNIPTSNLSLTPLIADDAKTLLDLKGQDNSRYQPVAITSWGGYALYPFVINTLHDETNRWVINPIVFFAQALHLPPLPVPDTTTENGQRILISHIDGDGFVSQAETLGYPSSGEVMLKEILQKYPSMPITVSIIEGEIGPDGLYPEKSAQHEKTAREIFSLTNIEIASHAYSHPFKWKEAVEDETSEDYHLNIPGYTFNLDREIGGSTNYINSRLAPPNKKTKVFLWTGDCEPTTDAIRATREKGLLNMNGGDTLISKTMPTLTTIAPIGMYKGNELQIYAPNQNENVYTNNWTGPYYGFQRVIETFQMTESPRRIKPIDIYYHFYSASKRASLTALKRVYDWALAQPVNPMFSSDYIARAQGFFSTVITRSGDNRFGIHNAGALRTLRLPVSAGYPDMSASRNVAGFFDDQGVRYIHLTAGDADLALRQNKPNTPYLAYANAQLANWSPQDNGLQFALKGWLPLKFALGQAQNCHLKIGNNTIQGRFDGELTHFELSQHAASEITLRCQY